MSATSEGARMLDVCALEELTPDQVYELQLASHRIAVLRHGDSVFAFSSHCPHHGGPLQRGHVLPGVSSSAPGEMTSEPERPVVVCPWHAYEFSLESGAAVCDRKLKMRLYSAEVLDGRVRVELPARWGSESTIRPGGGPSPTRG